MRDNVVCDKKDHLFPPNSNLDRFFGGSLFMLSGDEWKKQRAAFEPAFQYKALRNMVSTFAQKAEKLLKIWHAADSKLIVAFNDVSKYSLDVIGIAGFGYEFLCFRQ